MTLWTFREPELQQPGARLPPGRAGLCGAVPNCCRAATCNCSLTPGAHLHLHICTCSSPGEQTGTFPAASASASSTPVTSRREKVCTSPSHCWGSAQLSAHLSSCQRAGVLSTLVLHSETSGDNSSTADFSK